MMIRPIPIFNGKYAVTSNGEVINTKTNKILKPYVSTNGYAMVSIQDRGEIYNKTIHRLVAQAFLPNPDNLPVVMHLNNNKLDNRVQNLKWGSQKENVDQAWADGVYDHVDWAARHNKEYILYHENCPVEKSIFGAKHMAEFCGITRPTVYNCANNMQDQIFTGRFAGFKIRKNNSTSNDHPLAGE